MAPTPRIVLRAAASHHHTSRLLRDAGPIVQVELPGPVVAWALSSHAAITEAIAHPAVLKDPKHWRAWRAGEIGRDWELITFVNVDNMFTRDDPDHRRLRKLMSPQTFTPKGVRRLRPRIQAIVAGLLDGLPARGTVDLKARFAHPLPAAVISELFGVAAGDRPVLHKLLGVLFDQHTTTASDAGRNHAELEEFLTRLVARKRADPGEDLTSELISIRAADGDRLSESELVWMHGLMLGAGFETTVNLITNTARWLLAHPDQRALLHNGTYPWTAAVEETLRFDTPTPNLPFRYTTETVTIAGVDIPAGEPLLMCFGAAGVDPAQHGPDADRFDLTRIQAAHLAFSDGQHFCLGAHLARLEATTAIQHLFERYPDMEPAAPPEGLQSLPSLIAGTVTNLPVRLGPPREAAR